jgi:hypothetical protein
MLKGAFQWYMGRLKARPYFTNCASGCVIFSTSDLITQVYAPADGKEFKYNPNRTALTVFYAGLLATPFWVKVYQIMDRTWPVISIPNAVKKGLTTYVCGWGTNIAFFSIMTSGILILDHKCYDIGVLKERVKAKLEQDLVPTMQRHFMFWSPHWIFIFYFLPQEVRLMYAASLALVWNAFLCYVQHRKALASKEPNAVHAEA